MMQSISTHDVMMYIMSFITTTTKPRLESGEDLMSSLSSSSHDMDCNVHWRINTARNVVF